MSNSGMTNDLIWAIVFVLEGASIIFLNFLGLIVFRRKVHRFKSCYMLMNQCLADLLIGVKVILYALDDILPTQAANFNQKDPYCGYRLVNSMLWASLMEGSTASLVLIALERVHAVFRPFKHRVLKPKYYIIAIATTWFVNLVRSTTLGVVVCHFNVPGFVISYVFVSIILLGLVIIVASYTAIYIKVKFFSMTQANSQSQAQTRLCKTFLYATIASFLTVVPAAIVQIVVSNFIEIPNSLHYTTLFVLFSNSMINFVIFSRRIAHFTKDLKNALCCKKAFTTNGCQPALH